MYKQFTMELAGRTLRIDIGRVAAQANGAAFMHYGDTVVLSTATASDKPREGIDFFPLSVEFEEKLYSVGKIPGGFNKREGKASENAVLTARVIDRPMRPLFPKDYRNDVTLNNLVMSVDPQCRPELVAMLGSAIATSISDIPFAGPCATTQVGMVDGEFIINPSQEQWKNGDLNLTVASTSEKVIMIEAGANEIPEDKMLEAIYKAHEINQEIIAFINQIVAEVGMNIQAAQYLRNCLQRSVSWFRHRRWKRQFLQMRSRYARRISVRLQKSWKRHLQRTKNGWRYWERQFISIRRRQSAK